MSGPDDDSPNIDDPDWVDNVVARALEKAAADGASPDDEAPTPEQTPSRPQPRRATDPASSTATNLRPDPRPAPQRQPATAPRRDPAPEPGVAAATRQVPQRQESQRVASTGSGPSTMTEEAAGGLVLDDQLLTDAGLSEDGVAPTHQAPDDAGASKRQFRQLIEWVAVIVGALVVALLIKTFLVQPFYIPSGSMSPTLNQDDRILVNKQSYNLHNVNRGDIVVFNTPENFPRGDVDHLIKRVIGLGDETINFSDGQVVIDGRLLNEPYIDTGVPSTWTAGLPPGCVNSPGDTNDGCHIPDGHVFVMGDNRTGSDDGRVFGPIPEDLIVGRAFLRVWPLSQIGFL